MKAMKFKEFVTFLLDKDGDFEEVKSNFNSSFYYMDDHWSSYYRAPKKNGFLAF